MTYTYDDRGGLTQAVNEDDTSFDYVYDSIGNRVLSQVSVSVEDFTVNVSSSSGTPLQGLNVYAFRESNQYTGNYAVTDENGRAVFAPDDFIDGNYKFRVDYLRFQFWSEIVQISGSSSLDIIIPEVTITLSVNKDGTSIENVNVYVFNESGTYLGVYGKTDADGNVTFLLPQSKNYKFRVDYLRNQIWSDQVLLNADMDIDFNIPHKDVTLTIKGVFDSNETLKQGVKVYLFSPLDRYLGLYQTTNEQGQVTFNLPQNEYKVRADYLNQQYWSEPFTWTDATVTISEGNADITVTSLGNPIDNVNVYVFSETGSYLGIHDITDENGHTSFRLPEGNYKFRADYMSNQYWSGTTYVVAHISNPVPISTGGGSFSLTLQKDTNNPITGVTCYLFNSSGTYLGENSITNDQGQIDFNLSDGSYKIRADYLGYQFWTEEFSIPDIQDLTLTIAHQDVMIEVEGSHNQNITPIPETKVYLFTPSNTYLGQYQTTDDQGQAIFNVPEKEYKVRADYLKQQYWSEPFTLTDKTIIINQGTAIVTMKQNENPLEQAKVYVFTESETYLGLNNTTNAQGIAEFILPEGTYRFRGDFQGNQYWATAQINAHEENNVLINTGGGSFTLHVQHDDGTPMDDIPVYLFNGSQSYLGLSNHTDSQGDAVFSLSDGNYMFRADYLGYQFWTDVFSVPDNLSQTLNIPHQEVTLTVNQAYDYEFIPLENLNVYLFKDSSYKGKHLTTNDQGQVTFLLPDQEYRFRVDYLKSQYWTDPFFWQDSELDIAHGKVNLTITHEETALENIPVYLFTESGSYLGIYQRTDALGNVQFKIPVNTYKFRIDYDSAQHWTEPITIIFDEEINLDINLP